MTRRVAHRILHLRLGNIEQRSDFISAGLALVLLLQIGVCLVDLVDGADLVQRQTNNTRLLGQRLQNGLTNPPNSVRDEFETTGLIETLRSLDQTEIALVDQVGKAKSLILILLGYRNHKTEVGLGEFFQRSLVALFDLSGQLHLFFSRNQLHFSNIMQIFV